jgi:hypothetical protein
MPSSTHKKTEEEMWKIEVIQENFQFIIIIIIITPSCDTFLVGEMKTSKEVDVENHQCEWQTGGIMLAEMICMIYC